MSINQILLGAFAFANVSIFAWSVIGVFSRTVAPATGYGRLKLAAAFSGMAGVYALVTSTSAGLQRQLLAATLFSASLALFWWAVRTIRSRPLTLAYSVDTPLHVQRSGPYRLIRHPFYASYLLTYLATLVGSGSILAAGALVLMVIVYFDAARREESKFARSALRTEYARYHAAAGMFVPRLSRLLAVLRGSRPQNEAGVGTGESLNP